MKRLLFSVTNVCFGVYFLWNFVGECFELCSEVNVFCVV